MLAHPVKYTYDLLNLVKKDIHIKLINTGVNKSQKKL